MLDDVPLEDALPRVKDILSQTIAGKMQWKAAGPPGAFVAERSQVSATLDRVPGAARRQMNIRLRFSPRGETDFRTGIQQHASSGEPLSAEIDLDSYLSRLYQVVSERAGEAPTLLDKFVEDVP